MVPANHGRIAVVPFGSTLFGRANGDRRTSTSGVLFVFAIASLAVYGIVIAGWASNSEISFPRWSALELADDRLRTLVRSCRDPDFPFSLANLRLTEVCGNIRLIMAG